MKSLGYNVSHFVVHFIIFVQICNTSVITWIPEHKARVGYEHVERIKGH